MALNKKLIHFNSFSNFNSMKLSANSENTRYTIGVPTTSSLYLYNGEPEILYLSIVYIKDTKQQWTHGLLYDCSTYDDTILLMMINDISANLTPLLGIINKEGDGTKYLSDDGTYKEINAVVLDGSITMDKLSLDLRNQLNASLEDTEEEAGDPGNSSYGRKEIIYMNTTVANIDNMRPNVIYWLDLVPQVIINSFEEPIFGTSYDVFTAIISLGHSGDGESVSITLPESVLWANGKFPDISVAGEYELCISRISNNDVNAGELSRYYAVLVPFNQVN